MSIGSAHRLALGIGFPKKSLKEVCPDHQVDLDPFICEVEARFSTRSHRVAPALKWRVCVSGNVIQVRILHWFWGSSEFTMERADCTGVLFTVRSVGDKRYAIIEALDRRSDHPDILLHASEADDKVCARWQAWSQRLGVPLLVEYDDGSIEAPFPYLGSMIVGPIQPRRRGRIIKKRRPLIRLLRDKGAWPQGPVVEEREIIARN